MTNSEAAPEPSVADLASVYLELAEELWYALDSHQKRSFLEGYNLTRRDGLDAVVAIFLKGRAR